MEWGAWANKEYCHAAMVMSCALDDDLLKPENWSFTEPKKFSPCDAPEISNLPECTMTIEGTLTTNPNNALLNILRFGGNRTVIAYKVKTDISEIESSVLDIANKTDFNTFKVETDRADKNFPISSMDFSKRIGGLILKNIEGKSVDVHNPDYLMKIEIREDYTYIYSKEIKSLFASKKGSVT